MFRRFFIVFHEFSAVSMALKGVLGLEEAEGQEQQTSRGAGEERRAGEAQVEQGLQGHGDSN